MLLCALTRLSCLEGVTVNATSLSAAVTSLGGRKLAPVTFMKETPETNKDKSKPLFYFFVLQLIGMLLACCLSRIITANQYEMV